VSRRPLLATDTRRPAPKAPPRPGRKHALGRFLDGLAGHRMWVLGALTLAVGLSAMTYRYVRAEAPDPVTYANAVAVLTLAVGGLIGGVQAADALRDKVNTPDAPATVYAERAEVEGSPVHVEADDFPEPGSDYYLSETARRARGS